MLNSSFLTPPHPPLPSPLRKGKERAGVGMGEVVPPGKSNNVEIVTLWVKSVRSRRLGLARDRAARPIAYAR